MAVSLSALSVSRYLHPWKIPGAHCSFLLEDGLEVLGKLENAMTSLGIKPAIFRLVEVPQPSTLPRAPGYDGYGTLSPKRNPLQNGIGRQSNFRKVFRERRIIHIDPLRVCDHSLLNSL
jgi:hypothetical protein